MVCMLGQPRYGSYARAAVIFCETNNSVVGSQTDTRVYQFSHKEQHIFSIMLEPGYFDMLGQPHYVVYARAATLW